MIGPGTIVLPNDALEVLVSSDGGVNWTQIWYKTATDLESNDGASTGSPGTFVNSGRITLSPYGNYNDSI